MKTSSKIYFVLSILLIGFMNVGTAQTRTRTTTKTIRTVTKKTPNRVVSVRTVPNRKVVKYQGQNYYYSNNRFYTYSRGRYIVIAPKIGFRINTLPANYRRIHFNNHI